MLGKFCCHHFTDQLFHSFRQAQMAPLYLGNFTYGSSRTYDYILKFLHLTVLPKQLFGYTTLIR